MDINAKNNRPADDNAANSSLSEAEKFLESLNLESAGDGTSTSTSTVPTGTATASTADHKDIMSFLDEIAQYPANNDTPVTTITTTTSESKQQYGSASSSSSSSSNNNNNNAHTATAGETNSSTEPSSSKSNNGGWMAWGNSLWSQAVQTTTDQITKSGVELPTAKILEDRVKQLVSKENLGKLGSELRNLTTTLLDTVAPPISEHEVVEIFMSHDMVGYGGFESLVYRAFARVMEQIESAQVVVHRVIDKEDEATDTRDLNLCEGLPEGTKLAKANLDHLIKSHYKVPEAQTQDTAQWGVVPVINSPVYLAIQPVSLADEEDGSQVIFVVVLVDPTHQLRFKTYSQALPQAWLDIPYKENEWVEDMMAEVIWTAVTTIAQDYVYTRMTGAQKEIARVVAETESVRQAKEQ